MNRGDFVTIAMPGNFGKPRPALVIQSDQFGGHATVTVLLVSSALVNAPLLRVTVHPAEKNGLQKPSQVMVDKAMTVKRDKLGKSFGSPRLPACGCPATNVLLKRRQILDLTHPCMLR